VLPNLVNRAGPAAVALETTLLLHGVPRATALGLSQDLALDVAAAGAHAALVGVVDGVATVGLTDEELQRLLAAESVPKANTSNLGLLMSRSSHAATTVSTTMELAAAAHVQVFATGGLGGVHRGYGQYLDISADLTALARFPVAVVAAGVKSTLDVSATREMLETLGVPVVGFRTDEFPAFYQRSSGIGVDGRFDDVEELARFVGSELARTGRGIVIANPIAPEFEIAAHEFGLWLAEIEAKVRTELSRLVQGRDATPKVLSELHDRSGGKTLRANVELVRSNARLAGVLAVELARL
jgi:pseudouridine-5'-phosphate glycosidase